MTASPPSERVRTESTDTTAEGVWKRTEEVGSTWGVVLVSQLALRLGRKVARAFLWPIAGYFFLTRPDRVEACRQMRRRVGADTGSWELFRHLLAFAHVALDRLFFLTGERSAFRLFHTGHEFIEEMNAGNEGALLFGCHLGSFEALRAVSRDYDFPVHIVADFENAQRMNAILNLVGDNRNTRFLDAGADRIILGLKVREIVQAGGVVAILADRAGHGKSIEVDFLGDKAPFPTGPHALAAHAGCRVYFTTGFYTAPNRYEFICEPLFERVNLPRNRRQEALIEHVQAYADRLAHYARKKPDNWFNFYPFWSTKNE